ncbi:unnamed protein product [Brugia timori]|uniref:Bm13130 n=2 Tax=Brugia TaxID=6278 RepID=A0A1I9G3E5_BRUMA|nr:Bm13130 [Brugia malayi]VDO37755.1 unnamed protein product [Brugia timori]
MIMNCFLLDHLKASKKTISNCRSHYNVLTVKFC